MPPSELDGAPLAFAPIGHDRYALSRVYPLAWRPEQRHDDWYAGGLDLDTLIQ